ncbi:ABC transporter permease [Paramicrobacterium agarici]|uniref:ABC transporter permease n=1 Tax=Paramicrobacterium agarici TaxID=630514 RepID=UPI00114EAF4E|nr:ABC transporter permease [Microbacterium agarici]TQO22433.1 ABC-2 type transport system permease protein [Microbacterium agarici]
MTTVVRRTPRYNPTVSTYKTGLKRGLISARIQLTTPSEIVGTLVMMTLMVVSLIFLSQGTFGDASVDLGAMGLPGVIAMGVLFSGVMGIVGVLSMDRTNGTLLRSKSVPGGTTGYLVGEITANLISTVVSALLMLVVGLLLFDGLEFASPLRWLLFASVLVLGMVSTLAIGAVLGALVSNPKFMGFVMMPVLVLVGISGIFYPIVALPGWLQGVAQAFPLYWYGLGLRASLLPDAMSAVEISGSWRLEWVFIVLAAWAVVCLAIAPKLLGRMARRESGSTLAARRLDVQQQWGV